MVLTMGGLMSQNEKEFLGVILLRKQGSCVEVYGSDGGVKLVPNHKGHVFAFDDEDIAKIVEFVKDRIKGFGPTHMIRVWKDLNGEKIFGDEEVFPLSA